MIDPKTLKYSESHEWVHLEGDVATIGITKFAAEQLTDLILIDLSRAAKGTTVSAGKPFGEIESVKAVADLYAPITGEVLEVNMAVVSDVQVLAEDPYEKGWLLKVRPTRLEEELPNLMDLEAYERKIAESPH